MSYWIGALPLKGVGQAMQKSRVGRLGVRGSVFPLHLLSPSGAVAVLNRYQSFVYNALVMLVGFCWLRLLLLEQ